LNGLNVNFNFYIPKDTEHRILPFFSAVTRENWSVGLVEQFVDL